MLGILVLEDIILKGAKPATQSSLYPSNHILIKEKVGHAHILIVGIFIIMAVKHFLISVKV